MTEKVFSAENVPVDIMKVKASHAINGSQRLMRGALSI
jgi:hypothetical protein